MELRTRLALIALLAVALWGAPAPGPALAASQAAERYIVTLAAPPATPGAGRASISAADAARTQALAEVAAIVGAPFAPIYVYRYAINGFAAALTPAEAAAAAALPGVAMVTPEAFRTLQSDRGPAFIGTTQPELTPALFGATLGGATGAAGRATASFNAFTGALQLRLFYSGLGGAPTVAQLRAGDPAAESSLVLDLAGLAIGTPGASGGYQGTTTLDQRAGEALGQGQLFVRIVGPAGTLSGRLVPGRGEGLVVGVLDGGINPEHPAFQDPAPDGYRHSNPLGAGNYLGVCDPANPRFDPTFRCNGKLIGAYTYDQTASFPDPQGRPSPRDDDGHGSHTAGTAAGNRIAGPPSGPLAGVAPRANLIVYDVCGTITSSSTCSTIALVAAIDQAIADGVDAINYSIGGDTTDPWRDPEARGLLSAHAAGIFVAVSAGNEGPDPGTISSPANAPWVVAVAASTHDRRFVATLGGFAGGDGSLRPSTLTGTGVAPGLATPTPLIDAAALTPANRSCGPFSPSQAAQVAGRLVLCDNFGGAAQAAPNLWAAGAAGAVFVNSILLGDEPVPAVFSRPAVLLSATDGATLRAWLRGCTGCVATLGGTTSSLDATGDLVAEFSSRGPDEIVPAVLRPDLAAPGVDILAASADFDPAADDYDILSGTSMAAPHVAGFAALLRQLHPDWTPAELRSAMMLTARSSLLLADGATAADPFARGAGRIDARAAFAGFVLDEEAASFAAADPAAGGVPASLNLASLSDDACLLTCTFTRTLRSTLGVPLTWSIEVRNGDGFALSTQPAGSLTLEPGAERTIVVTATAAGPARERYGFGELIFTPRVPLAPVAAMPVAIKTVRSTLAAPLELTTALAAGGTTIPLRALAIEELSARTYGLVKLTTETQRLAEDPTPGDPGDIGAGGVLIKELTLPAGTTRLRVQLGSTTARDLDLYLLGDGDGDGFAETLCQATSPGNGELCELQADDLVRGRSTALDVVVLVQNFRGSGAAFDSFELLYGLVGTTSAGNLAAAGPEAVPAGQPFELELSWELGAPRSGDVYIGVLLLAGSSDPAAAGDRGAVPVTITYKPNRVNLPLLRR